MSALEAVLRCWLSMSATSFKPVVLSSGVLGVENVRSGMLSNESESLSCTILRLCCGNGGGSEISVRNDLVGSRFGDSVRRFGDGKASDADSARFVLRADMNAAEIVS